MEVADVMMIEDREVIFFTQGGDYVAPLLADGDGGNGGGSSSGLPAVVGAYRVSYSSSSIGWFDLADWLHLNHVTITTRRKPPITARKPRAS